MPALITNNIKIIEMNAIPDVTHTNTYGGSENDGSTIIGSGSGFKSSS